MTQVSILTALAAIYIIFCMLKLLRNFKFRKQNIKLQGVYFDFIDNFLNIDNSFGKLGEYLLHLVSRLKVVFLIRHTVAEPSPSSYWSGQFFRIFDTEQNVMGMGNFFIYIIGVLSCHQFLTILLCHLH